MENNKDNNKSNRINVVVAMSGGVDSSVAAALLKKQGYNVVGAHLKFWHEGRIGAENRCCTLESERKARLVAKKLNIPFYVFNFEKEFKKKVVDYFLKEYKAGRTPNPCVVCNKEIKFGLLIKKALELGADYVATGHYARLRNTKKYEYTKTKKGKKNSYIRKKFVFRSILKGKDKNKDQSYFLWQLNQKQLKHILFPVGGYTKPEVRKLAKKFKLPTAETPESQEVCFIKDKTNNFLKKYIKAKKGEIRDNKGNILGEHQGLCFYTIGQRKGISLPGGPYYVLGKDTKKNILIVTQNEKDLLKKELTVKNVNWISNKESKLPIKVMVKIRYRSKPALAIITKILNSKSYILKFQKPQRAITSGQSAVFYAPVRSFQTKKGEGCELLGGGVII